LSRRAIPTLLGSKTDRLEACPFLSQGLADRAAGNPTGPPPHTKV